ncbi:MAG TPA: membrane dipeptidase [Bryobacteraceae bacterium]|jgi:membrane dipeptidase|nr:membrane dipeptidase [Bryobacteraceae bacterium]
MINRGRFALFAKGAPEYSARAVDLVHRSTVIDMLGLLTLDYRKMSAWQMQPERFQPGDFQRLKNSGTTVFYPAVGYTAGDIYTETARDILGWNTFLAAHPQEFLRVDEATDFERAKALGKIGILIGQQNSVHFRTLADVDCFYGLGQRVSQLTYTGNRIGGGSSDAHDSGLSQYGAQVVERMNQLGMAIDVSHCGDRTTMDAIVASRRPVLVTHSNCRALVPAARCKTDEAIRAMAAKGGVMGITMVRGFVRAGGPATIENVLDHIDHVVALAGVEHVGVGSDVDLDGRDVHPVRKYDLDGIDYAKKIFDLTEGLVRRSYSNRNIELILGGNFQRALAEAWVPAVALTQSTVPQALAQ